MAIPALHGAAQTRTLEPGQAIERELTAGEEHSYSLHLEKGQYLHIEVDRKSIDVTATLYAPDGRKIFEVNPPIDRGRLENLFSITDVAGAYRVEVWAVDKNAAGRYQIKIAELRAAAEQDHTRVKAERAYVEGQRLFDQNPREAFKQFEVSLPVWRALGLRVKETATLTYLGQILDIQGETRRTLDYYTQSLQGWREMGDRQNEAYTLNHIGNVYERLGERRKALDHYDRALSLFREVADRGGEIELLNNIGTIYSVMAEYQKALDHFEEAVTLARAERQSQLEAVCLGNIGFVYGAMGDYQTATDYYSRALDVLRAADSKPSQQVILNALGSYIRLQGDPRKAVGYHTEALAISRSLGNRRREALALTNLGLASAALGENHKALDYYLQAIALRQQVGDRAGESVALSAMGDLYASSGEQQKAAELYRKALDASRSVADRAKEAVALGGLARVERARGNLAQARAHIESAIAIIESVRASVAAQELRASYLSSAQKHYEFLIDLLMRGKNPAAALQIAERARARGLLEMLTESRANIRQGVDPALIGRERELKQLLDGKAESQMRLLSARHTAEQADAIEKEIRAITTEYRQIQSRIRATSPRYAALVEPQPLTLGDIQRRVLDSDTLLLEYSLGEDRSFLWVVAKDSMASFELPPRKEIETTARRVYQSFSVAGSDASGTEAAEELSRMLLAPARSLLGNRRLVVVADGALQYVPFAALPEPKSVESGKSNDYRQPMIVNHEIVTLPSASTLAVLRREFEGRRPASALLAVLADPVFDRDDPRVRSTVASAGSANKAAREVDKSARESGVISFDRLRSTRREAEEILSLAPKDQSLRALDFRASLKAATSEELSNYRIIHFASHGLLNSLHPELSGIVLSMVDERGMPQNGFLRAHEIYNLKLNADLVVLSGCQTALGKEVRGEGLMGLSRGFMYAGAQRVVASVWRVPDRATAELMKHFYKAMFARKLRPAAALRAAQIEMRKQERWSAPYYWAAFTLQGEWK